MTELPTLDTLKADLAEAEKKQPRKKPLTRSQKALLWQLRNLRGVLISQLKAGMKQPNRHTRRAFMALTNKAIRMGVPLDL